MKLTVKPSRENVTFGVVASLTLLLAVVEWFWLFPSSMPDEEEVIALYATHQQEFADLTKIFDKGCAGPGPPEALAITDRFKFQPSVYCNDNGEVRLILYVKGLSTIGPERSIGLMYIPGDTKRVGPVVPVLAPHTEEVGTLYLRQIERRWYVYYQNSDD